DINVVEDVDDVIFEVSDDIVPVKVVRDVVAVSDEGVVITADECVDGAVLGVVVDGAVVVDGVLSDDVVSIDAVIAAEFVECGIVKAIDGVGPVAVVDRVVEDVIGADAVVVLSIIVLVLVVVDTVVVNES
ncbi:hypothetical protein MHBO_003857, partial [Bonamia ostreae]